MTMQALFDGLSAQWKRERAATQMTLGGLISMLKTLSKDTTVANLHGAHSYRGYYSDLAFEMGDGTRLATELLAECNAAMGQVFCGYKGGDYVMGALTPVWVAQYGCCGEKLIALHGDGSIETEDDSWE